MLPIQKSEEHELYKYTSFFLMKTNTIKTLKGKVDPNLCVCVCMCVYQWLRVTLWYLQYINNGDSAVFYWAIDLAMA